MSMREGGGWGNGGSEENSKTRQPTWHYEVTNYLAHLLYEAKMCNSRLHKGTAEFKFLLLMFTDIRLRTFVKKKPPCTKIHFSIQYIITFNKEIKLQKLLP